MDRTALIIVAGATVGAAYLITRHQLQQLEADAGSPMPDGPQPEDSTNIIDTTMSAIRNTFQLWRPPAKYAAAIAAAEDQNGIPRDLLARLLWQESRYREDIITGKVKSPAGAMGIAQFMPATAAEMGVNPLEPFAAIAAAGVYLARLFRRFGNWTEALAAYNWGQGNVSRKGLAQAPRETRNYYTSILLDVNTANGTAYA